MGDDVTSGDHATRDARATRGDRAVWADHPARDEQESESELRIITAERLNFFSDAVVAIAITLLALDLPVPDGSTNAELWRDLGGHLNDYIAFVISFAVIGNHWFVHHRTFSHLASIGGLLARWNMLWLLMIVLTPFATRVIVADGAFAARFTIYALVQAMASSFFLLAVREMDRHRLVRVDTPPAMFAHTYRRVALAIAAFLLSIPVALITHWAYVCWAIIPLVPRLRHLLAGVWHRVRPVARPPRPDAGP